MLEQVPVRVLERVLLPLPRVLLPLLVTPDHQTHLFVRQMVLLVLYQPVVAIGQILMTTVCYPLLCP